MKGGDQVKKIVDEIKKRIELRPDPEITTKPDEAKKIIKEMVSEEAGIGDILFDPRRSIVTIHAEKPGIVIGKQGSLLREIRKNIFWIPTIKRNPAIKSKLIEDIRAVLYQNSDYRRKFLDKVGHRIYDGWIRGKKEEWVRVSFLGGGRQVGRSALLLQTPESRVLLDCGINVASDEEPYPYLDVPEFKINELDAVIVTHSHLDHSGFVPWLFKYGYRGPVYCTEPTRDISSLLALDYVKIMRNYKGKDPIYTSDDIKEMVKHTIVLNYEEVTDVTPDVRITLYNAGHILGSAMIHLHIGNGLHNLLYTGDIKFARTHLLDPAATKFPRLETAIIESTYGGKNNIMPPLYEADEILRGIIETTIKKGGKILMPVLGSGRAQEVMVTVEEMIREGKLKEVPIFIDGMVWDITAIHTAYPEFMNSKIRRRIFHRDENPFLSPIFRRVGSAKERKKVIEEEGPCIIMATSGMLVGGPSVEYLRNLADDKKNSLVFTCYQGEGSLGRRIQQGLREVTFKEGNSQEIVPVNMEVHKVEITGHSDRRQLMAFIQRCYPSPRKVIVNHGESSRCLDLSASIHKAMRVETVAPRNIEAVRVR